MQNGNAEEMADFVIKEFSDYFGDRFKDYCIFNLSDKPYKEFSINFEAYNYFFVLFNYDRGIFGCSIQYGEYSVELPNSQQWFDKADFRVFCEELKRELELRIPDKFLRAHGWLK